MHPRKIFGTDGVRGTANTEPVTAETALKLGRAAGHVFKNLETPVPRPGPAQDCARQGHPAFRLHARKRPLLRHPLDGRGRAVHRPAAHPGVAYVTRSLRADAGIVITASHNPYDDNGIKFFRADGYKLDDKIEYQIESLVFSGEIENIRPTADAIGKAVRIDDALGRYIEYAKASFPRGMTLEGIAHRRGLRARRRLQIHSLRAARTGRRGHRLRQPARRQEHQQGLRLDASRPHVPEDLGAPRRPGHRARRRRRPRPALRREGRVD